MFSVGLRLALPVVALLVMVDVALALLGRLNPQLQLLSLAFPVKMLTALLAAGLDGGAVPARSARSCAEHALAARGGVGRILRARKPMATEDKRPSNRPQRRLEKAREEGNFPARGSSCRRSSSWPSRRLLAGGERDWFGRGSARPRVLCCARAFAPRSSDPRTSCRSDLATCSGGRSCRWLLAARRLAVATLAHPTGGDHAFGFSLKKAGARISTRLNPLARLRELPRQNLPALLQAVVMLPLFCGRCTAWCADKLDAVPGAAARERGERARVQVGARSMALFWKAAARVPGLRRGGPVPPDARATSGTCA